MDSLSIDQFKSMITRALVNVKARANEFSAMDAVCGDGDHGTAIVDALAGIKESADKGTEFKSMLNDMAMAAMRHSCGSTSTLIGAFFMGMATRAEGDALDIAQVRSMFNAGLETLKRNTKAQPGDKTIMDALVPAVEAFSSDSEDMKELFAKAAAAASKGAESTIGMKAAFGRAKNLGERSIGSPDPGAYSWACMFDAFSEVL